MKAVFVTHAGPETGGGHLSRCFALSQALRDKGAECRWILNDDAKPQAASLGITNAAFFSDPFGSDAPDFPEGSDFAVVDSYAPGEDFYKSAAARTRLVAIDDLHDRGVERFASVVVNYGIEAKRELYGVADCEYLLGPRYALLRKEYWDMTPAEGDYVLFVPGAADVAGCSAALAGWWRDEMGKLVIALGSLVTDCRREQAFCAARGHGNVEILVSPPGFASLLANAGRVICSASVTAYEALAMEKKTAVFAVAENQRGLGERLSEIGAAYDLGNWERAGFGSVKDALGFVPALGVLRGLVNKRGAAACAEGILDS